MNVTEHIYLPMTPSFIHSSTILHTHTSCQNLPKNMLLENLEPLKVLQLLLCYSSVITLNVLGRRLQQRVSPSERFAIYNKPLELSNKSLKNP